MNRNNTTAQLRCCDTRGESCRLPSNTSTACRLPSFSDVSRPRHIHSLRFRISSGSFRVSILTQSRGICKGFPINRNCRFNQLQLSYSYNIYEKSRNAILHNGSHDNTYFTNSLFSFFAFFNFFSFHRCFYLRYCIQ